MLKAYLEATAAMAVAIVTYFLAIRFAGHTVVSLFGYAIPVIGGAVGAFFAPRSKFNVGFSTVVAAILLIAVGGYIGGVLGFGDFIGFEGTVIATILSVPIVAIASAVGALVGEWLAGRQARA